MNKSTVKNKLKNRDCFNCAHCTILVGGDHFRKMQEITFKEITGVDKEDIKHWMMFEDSIVECRLSKYKLGLIPPEQTCEGWEGVLD